MIIRKESEGQLTLIGQTDHSRLVGQLAAHWGNDEFARPEPYQAVVRAAVFHDYGWLSYETDPQINPESGEPYEFRQLPFNPKQLEGYQWCIDWLSEMEPFAGLMVSMHRTGLWKQRYGAIAHPTARVNPQSSRPEIQEFIERNEARQEAGRKVVDADALWRNYRLLQVWDLLGLYFCCQEPYDDYIEPVPVSAASDDPGVKMTMKPLGDGRVAFDPYPFDVRPLRVQIGSKCLAQASFPSLPAFQQAYFQADNHLLEYELV
jgi:hypothetical protein